jgi:CelD/BcsL family acetyltransferase involved in cellulose biosynthesis
MTVYQLDPLTDPRWRDLVQRHARASVFHTCAWLDALKRTYRYEPTAFTTSSPRSELQNAVVFCDIRSWMTGHRLVSLPFSDHCDPLVDDGEELGAISRYLDRQRASRGWDYIELRPQLQTASSEESFKAAAHFWHHQLDLRPSEDDLYDSFNKSSIQRKIRRAARENVTYGEGRTDDLLRAFYDLLLVTRRRHGIPPQPFSWFRNLSRSFGSAMKVRVARVGGRAIAALVTLSHRDTMVYKYGASDAAFHRVGGMHLLFWRAIQDARASGHRTFDLGRCDEANTGLMVFKERWGAARTAITYSRCADTQPPANRLRRYAFQHAGALLGYVPIGCRAAAGKLLYRHAG